MSGTALRGQTTPLEGAARDAWVRAQALWNVRLHDARLRPGAGAERGAPAWFSFPPEITVDPDMIAAFGATNELESVFAHEVGHHVLAPSTRVDALKIRHQLARTLVSAGAVAINADHVGLLANLWTDLLINHRLAILQRQRGEATREGAQEPGVIRLSRLIHADSRDTNSRLWWVYLRTYEHLWSLPSGSLCLPEPPDQPPPLRDDLERTATAALVDRDDEQSRRLREAQLTADRAALELARATTTHPALDADLLAAVVRTFAADPVGGALRFGVLMAPYVLADGPGAGQVDVGGSRAMPGAPGAPAVPQAPGIPGLPGVSGCAADSAPATAAELGRILADPRLSAPLPERGPYARADHGDEEGAVATTRGQAFGLSQTLELYATTDADEVIAAWYRSQAARWVRPYTEQRTAFPSPDLPGPIELWENGDDLADLDWPATLQSSVDLIPGVTTRRRSTLPDEPTPVESSIELDLYIDSSGSMPRPERESAPILAGTILALSVLRGGGRVRVTSFSGPGQVAGTERFSRDASAVIRGLAAYFGMGTTFPLDLLERRYGPLHPPDDTTWRHLVVLSDDGLVSMFGHGNEPYAHVAAAARTKVTTATLILLEWARGIEPTAQDAGYDCAFVGTMQDAPRVCAQLAEVLHG
ncbi:MAG: VWA domain-containing protein [Phycicoccus sp.]|nr:VWA domain-containing protein [Phycicoccus sp.]